MDSTLRNQLCGRKDRVGLGVDRPRSSLHADPICQVNEDVLN